MVTIAGDSWRCADCPCRTEVAVVPQCLNMKSIPIYSSREILSPNKDYTGQVCLEPFNTVSVGPDGEVRMCGCAGWMPTSIGNIYETPLDELLASELAQRIRQSVRDGTYQYCNEKTCGILINKELSSVKEIAQSISECGLKPAGWELYVDETRPKTPVTYFIAGDLVCNLSCPSCRTEVISQSKFEKLQKHNRLNVLVKQMFEGSDYNNVDIHISTSGEIFASNALMGLMVDFPITNYPNSRFWIQTNGLLLKRRWKDIEFLGKNIADIAVTADSSRRNVYEKLRRGGKFDVLEENLNFLTRLKQEFNFTVDIRMVVQYDNHDEIEEFYYWAKQFGADKVSYLRITDWGTFTPMEFKQKDVLDVNHESYGRTINALKKLQQDRPDVWVSGFNLE